MGGLLVVMGSGETAPTMVKPHRAIFERVGDAPAVLIDTPYGFQENADDISTKAIAYFAASVGRQISALSWRTTPPPGLARDRALARLDEAGWIFAGPGSPTYALRQWTGTPAPPTLGRALGGGGGGRVPHAAPPPARPRTGPAAAGSESAAPAARVHAAHPG